MRRSRSMLSVTVFLMLVMFPGMRAFSQDPPDVAMGMSPQATYHSGEFDFVDMSTGRLNLHIPLVEDHSQRGKLNFTYSVTYSSTGSWTGVLSNNNFVPRFYIKPPKYGSAGPAFVMDGQLGSPSRTVFNDRSYPGGYSAAAWSVYDSGWGIGTLHPLGNSGSVLESIDGSGIASASTTTPYLTTNNEGIQFYHGPGPAPETDYVQDGPYQESTTAPEHSNCAIRCTTYKRTSTFHPTWNTLTHQAC